MISNKIDSWNTIKQIFLLHDTPPAQRHLLHALLYFAGRNNRAFPAMKTLSEATGIKDRSLQKHMAGLVEAGLVHRDLNGGPGGANLYRLTDKLVQPEAIATVQTTDRPSQSGKPSQSEPEAVSDPRNICGVGGYEADLPGANYARAGANIVPLPMSKTAPVTCKGTVNLKHVSRGLDSDVSWKALKSEGVTRILTAANPTEFLAYDREGCQTWGWLDSEQAQITRCAIWAACARFCRVNGGNAAALLVSAMRGDTPVEPTQTDEDAARAFLRRRASLPTVNRMKVADFETPERSKIDQMRALSGLPK